MSTMQQDHEIWLKEAKAQGAKWLVNVCDTFDYENYPVYCKDDKELEEAKQRYDGQNMQRIEAIVEVK